MGRLNVDRARARPAAPRAPQLVQIPADNEIIAGPTGSGKSLLSRRRVIGHRDAPETWREASKLARAVLILDDSPARSPTGFRETKSWEEACALLRGEGVPKVRLEGVWPEHELGRLARGGLLLAVEEIHRRDMRWQAAFAQSVWNVKRHGRPWRGAVGMRTVVTCHILQGVHQNLRANADAITCGPLDSGAAAFALSLDPGKCRLTEADFVRFRALKCENCMKRERRECPGHGFGRLW